MPTYVNSSTTDVKFIGLFRIEPGQTLKTSDWIYNLPAGVTMTSNLPVYDPVISSQKVTSTSTVAIPVTATDNYNVRIYVSTGEVSVKVNDASTVARIIGSGDVWSVFCSTRIIDTLIFTITTGTAYLTVEKS